MSRFAVLVAALVFACAAPKAEPAAPAAPASKGASIVTHAVLGFALGAPFEDAIKSAPAGLSWTATTGPHRRATGSFEGWQLSAQLVEGGGRLADVQISLTDAQDAGLADGKPFAALKAALGEPTRVSGDSAQWGDATFEVVCSRSEVFEKGDDDAQIEYSLRARLLPIPAPAPRPEGEEARKQREADRALGK